MNKMKVYSFGAGMLTGLVVGAVTGMLADPLKDKDSKKLQTQGKGLFKSIGGVIDNMFESKN